MTQKEQIIKTAIELIAKNGSTTTLEVKNDLRNKFPEGEWRQNRISEYMADWVENNALYTFDDNGSFRTYRKEYSLDIQGILSFITPINSVFNPVITPKFYSVQLSNVLTIQGTKEEILKSSELLGYDLHYSTTKDDFELVENMHPIHLFYVIKEGIETCKTPQELLSYIENSAPIFYLLHQNQA